MTTGEPGKRILALDVGDRRIGVAVGDPTGLLATPIDTVDGERESLALDEVVRLIADYEVEEIVVGLPLSLSGRPGAQARRVREFAEAIGRRVAIEVVFQDERYSSVQAERLLRESGKRPSRDKGRVDSAAAAIILQSYLDSRRASSR